MNTRTLGILGTSAVVLAALAAWAARDKGPATAEAGGGEPRQLIPGLTREADQVATIEIQNKDGSFQLARQGEQWTMPSRGGYPVNFDKVRELVNQIAYFEIVEAKTDNPELYSKLQVEDVGPEAASSRVTLRDGAGKVLADVVIGKTAPGGGPSISTLYVRKAGEPRAWEVKGRVWIDATATNWLDKQIVKLERTRVHRATITHPDGSQLEVFKPSPDDKNYTLVGQPAGTELKWPGVADGVAGALEYLNFEDVQAAGQVDFADPAAVSARFQTFDGLLVTARLLEKDGKWYSRFEAAADPAARVEVETVTPPPPPPEPKEGEPPPPPAEPTVERKVPGKTAEEVAQEAQELQDRLSKWDYVLPGYTASNFTKKMADMLKEPTPAGPPAEGSEPPPSEQGADDPIPEPVPDPVPPPDAPPQTPPETPPAPEQKPPAR